MMRTFIVAMLVIFVVLAAGFFMLGNAMPEFQTGVLHTANAIMLALSLGAYLLVRRQLSGRPHAFVNGVMGASFMKLMVGITSMLVYVFLNRGHLHKPTIFVLLGIYAVYSATETILLSKIARTNGSNSPV